MDFSLLTCTVQTFKFQKWRLILFLCFRNDKFDVYILVKFKWKRKCSFYVTKCFAPKFELGKHKAKQIVRCVYVTRKDDWTMNWKVVENYNLPKKNASSDRFVSSPFEHDKFTVKIYGRKIVSIFPLFLLVSRLTHIIWFIFLAFSIFNPILNPIFDSSIIR